MHVPTIQSNWLYNNKAENTAMRINYSLQEHIGTVANSGVVMEGESSTFVSIAIAAAAVDAQRVLLPFDGIQNKTNYFYFFIIFVGLWRHLCNITNHGDECSLLTFHVKILNRELAKTKTLNVHHERGLCILGSELECTTSAHK